MKFLVDAHLPISIKFTLIELGHDVIHTLDLLNKNLNTDQEIEARSISEKRIVITKDSDFVNSFLLERRLYKLLLISTGNINNNKDLEKLIVENIEVISEEFLEYDFIELNRSQLVYHMGAVLIFIPDPAWCTLPYSNHLLFSVLYPSCNLNR